MEGTQLHPEEVELLRRQCEVLRAERDHARARVNNAVALLTAIHSCMYPSAVKMEDGRFMVFRPENPHEYLQALSDRIRALPDELVARGVLSRFCAASLKPGGHYPAEG